MAAILRWFHADGVRHRAYFRSSAEASTTRELVVAAPTWEAVRPANKPSLEDYTEEELVAIAVRLRASAGD